MPSTRSGASYTPQAAPKKVIDVIMVEANQLQNNKADTATKSLSEHLQTSQKAYNNAFQHKEYHILSDLWYNCINSYLNVRKFLGHPNTCKLLNGWHPLIEKKNMMFSTAEWRKDNPPPPKQVPKTAAIPT
ncbi:hypothetical protein O181_131072 [Austropuccinia psidii MF-1]|uniref:Uncharacterized protein n=1 Tax=Austropuccinia psidii MF-1 TaxID=1389203 RepID=A0A9Q3L2C7_9BASI|nr:hypothetical protein [Austropuccinia psidii MF-1]